MRRSLIAAVLLAAMLSVLAVAVRDTANAAQTADVTFRQSSGAVDVYDFVEVMIDVARPTAANPFTDVAVTGELRCNDGEPAGSCRRSTN